MSKQKIEKLERLIADKSISADEKKIYKEALDKLVKKSVTAKRSARKKTTTKKTPAKELPKNHKIIGSYRTKAKAETMRGIAENSESTKRSEYELTFYVQKIPAPKTELKYDLIQVQGKKKTPAIKKSMLKAIENDISAGDLSVGTGLSDYKDIDKLRSKMLSELRKSDMEYSLENLRKLAKKHATSIKKEEDFDCDELIEEEKKRVADRRKRYEENKSKRESTKNVERTNKLTDTLDKSIKKRLESGKDVSKTEIEKLIKEVTEILNMLKKALKKAS